ncbi:replication initiator [Nocardioides insulae]|uniref:replication initiator n=1 Tax=Nocardioides insulae TaxID=394734 RepID=UPI0004159D9F|nr:replication initiator [Nocardioides insulae]
MTTAPALDPVLDPGRHPVFLAEAGLERAEQRARGCANPVRLRGSRMLVDTTTGEVHTAYSSDDELDGYTYVRCGNRRASVCPSCSREYKGDAWHLLMCGLAGGRGISADVADRPATFATLTAPSFGAVHGIRQKGPCRARRDKPVCPHGRPAWCNRRHQPGDPRLGEPLCLDCYDYTGHVLWQWHAPELWRRFTIALQRHLAHLCGLTVKAFRERCRIAYSKVVEFQARGIVHFHAPIRLDGSDGPDGQPPQVPVTTSLLEQAVQFAAAQVRYRTLPLGDGVRSGPVSVELRWGDQIDCRSITGDAERDTHRAAPRVHPEQVAAYLAKYLTKTTEDFGLPAKVRNSLHARAAGASPHAVRIIQAALDLAAQADQLARPLQTRLDARIAAHRASVQKDEGDEPGKLPAELQQQHTQLETLQDYTRLADRLATLGYRGHPITKSHAYSITFGQIRRSRRAYRRDPGLDPDADIRQILDDDTDVPDGFEVVSSWIFAGQGYLDLDQAAAAVRSAAMARADQ